MKRYYFILLAFCCTIFSQIEAQTIVSVPPGSTLNNVITTDADRIYELTRGAIYFVNAPISHQGFHLHIRSTGNPDFARPLIVADPPSADVDINALFEARDQLTLEGVHLTQRNTLGATFERMIRARANDIRITLRDCLLDDTGQTVFRLDNAGAKIYVYDCVASRLGEPSNPDNGRFIDDRGVLVDTIVIENSLIYGVTSRIIRDGGSDINYARFNQSTFANTGQRCFALGPVGTLIFTNNIVADGIFLARGIDDDRTTLDPDTTAAGIGSWVIGYNNFFISPEVAALTPEVQSDNDTIELAPYFNAETLAAIAAGGWENTNLEEVLDFANPAPVPVDFIETHHNDGAPGPWDHSGLEADEALTSGVGSGTYPRYSTYHNYGYPQSAASYTGGTDGQPLGANLPGFDFMVNVSDLIDENRILYYPNPVGESLFIKHLDGVAIEQAVIFDLQGRALRQYYPQAGDQLEANLNGLAPGVYVVMVTDARKQVATRKIVKQ